MPFRRSLLPLVAPLLLAAALLGAAGKPPASDSARAEGGFATEPPRAEAVPRLSPAQLAATRFRAVLVAGDGSLPVFDNAVADMAAGLAAGGVSWERRLSSTPGVGAPATVRSVLDAVAALRPGPGEGCLVFATSHGAHDGGFLVGGEAGGLLYPRQLDAALQQGCGEAPTVVIMSACFSGGFARGPMLRPNRIILTAARPDRPSFGCGAGRSYTVFDQCLLGELGQDAAQGWRAVALATRGCVARAEKQLGELPSQPQLALGAAVAEGLAVPFRAAPAPARVSGQRGKPAAL